MTINHAARARALVGTRFRPQGRGAYGLDCLGLVLETYDIPAAAVRRDYRLRGDHRSEIERGLAGFFRRISPGEQRVGDLMLLSIADDQLHFAIRSERGFVHAHAGIGRVVETPGTPEWPLLGIYRMRARERKG
jgi:murein DD-endopeptidase / murein LD-carboxypeptidase